MNPYITEMEAIPVSKPHMVAVFNSNTLEETQHLAYEVEMQYKRKPNEIKTILCSRLDTVNVGEPVMLVYHHGMRSYKHNRNVIVSNSRNCLGGFYYTDGTKA